MSIPQLPDETMHGADGEPLVPQPAHEPEDIDEDEGRRP